MISIKVNGKSYDLEVAPDARLLWVIRENIGLTGTKFCCGQALCGACTVHVNGQAVRSCVTPVSSVAGQEIVTIEGLAPDHPVKKAWIAEQVPQCGYCQPGQIMQAAAFLRENPGPTEEQILEAMEGNLCRCGTYPFIKRAIKRAAKEVSQR
ncbi:MAG: (2Fe-2S)-binding protein [Deltaproteobacteria bacterium]|nr:(2Fe-2S)-binding protein [Deltaproteobacteria bacterium]